MKKCSEARFFAKLALLFTVGVLILLYGSGGWLILGYFIVGPVVTGAVFMAWCYLVYKIVTACGGDPKDGNTGILAFVSFAFLLVPLLHAFLRAPLAVAAPQIHTVANPNSQRHSSSGIVYFLCGKERL